MGDSYIPRLSSAYLRQWEALQSEQEVIRQIVADETGRLSKNKKKKLPSVFDLFSVVLLSRLK
jgi:hypothetical protein